MSQTDSPRDDGRTPRERMLAGDLGADTVVGAGAGAVVARDLPDGVLAVGAPARVVRSLRE